MLLLLTGSGGTRATDYPTAPLLLLISSGPFVASPRVHIETGVLSRVDIEVEVEGG